jgi:uncharacterized membrane protein YqaE (UPF0057 family)
MTGSELQTGNAMMNKLELRREVIAPPPAELARGTGTVDTVPDIAAQKSVGLAMVLALLFGPLGMIYSTGIGAAVMFVMNIILIGAGAGGAGLLLSAIGCAMWAGVAAGSANDRARVVPA